MLQVNMMTPQQHQKLPLIDNREETILQLKEVNDKFRQRVAELELIVKDALHNLENPQNQEIKRQEKNFFSHRVQPMQNHPEIAQKLEILKQHQNHIIHQQQTIKSLRNRIDAVTDEVTNTSLQNKVNDIERQNRETKNLLRTLSLRNDEQFQELDTLNNDTDYGNQMNEMQRELGKWKDKYKMLKQYKKEEDEAFKSKFDYMMKVEMEKSKLKNLISSIKFAPAHSIIENNGEFQYTKKEQTRRGKSVSLLKRNQDGSENIESLVKQRDTIEKVREQTYRRYINTKREYEQRAENLIHEIENLKVQIINTESANSVNFEEVRELNSLNNTLLAELAIREQQMKLYQTINQNNLDYYNENLDDEDMVLQQPSSYRNNNRYESTSKQRDHLKSRSHRMRKSTDSRQYSKDHNSNNLNDKYNVSKSLNNIKFKKDHKTVTNSDLSKVNQPEKKSLYETLDSLNDRNITINPNKFQTPKVKENKIIFRYDNQEKLGVSAMNPVNNNNNQNNSKMKNKQGLEQTQPQLKQEQEVIKSNQKPQLQLIKQQQQQQQLPQNSVERYPKKR